MKKTEAHSKEETKEYLKSLTVDDFASEVLAWELSFLLLNQEVR